MQHLTYNPEQALRVYATPYRTHTACLHAVHTLTSQGRKSDPGLNEL